MSQFSNTVAAGLTLLMSFSESAARAQEPAQVPAPPASAVTSSSSTVVLHGYVDGFFAWNSNSPADHASFQPGTGTTAVRAGELAINQALLRATWEQGPVGAKLALVFGPGAAIVHGGEPVGPGVGPVVWQNLLGASVYGKLPEGTVLEGGIMPSHIGFETFPSVDNWNYTRSWMAEFSPYYQSGVSATHSLGEFTGQAFVLTGWQLDSDVNHSQSLGTSVAWNHAGWHVALNGWAGPELPNDDRDWRWFGDFVASGAPLPWLEIALCADDGYQARMAPLAGARWAGVSGFARVAVGRYAHIAARLERFRDADGVITGVGESLTEGTLTLEARPVDALIIKLEGRADESSAAVFSTRNVGALGAPILTTAQRLVILSAAVVF
jgi:hypothetical protein